MREAILALLKTRPRVGEQTLKLEARRQRPPVPAHKAEEIADDLVTEGLATSHTNERTGARYWALAGKVAAPPPLGTTEEPPSEPKPKPAPKLPPALYREPRLEEPTPAAPAAPPAPLPPPVEIPLEEPPPRPTACVGEPMVLRPPPPANDREPTPPPAPVDGPQLPADVLAMARALAALPQRERAQLGQALATIGAALAAPVLAPEAAPRPLAPPGLTPSESAVWLALSPTESRRPDDLAKALKNPISLHSVLRQLRQKGLAFSPCYGRWKRSALWARTARSPGQRTPSTP